MKAYLERLASRADLGLEEAREAMNAVMRGDASPVEIAAFLTALRVKGETPDEIAGCVLALREHVVSVLPRRRDLLDVVGTGGDGANTFNISTAAALLCCACGAAVAKHGNRAISSLAGSADVLEALGVAIDLAHADEAALVDEVGFAFLFAPSHHPAMRHAGPVRRELGIRTVMNLLGPLANPMGVSRLVIGVARPELVDAFGQVLLRLGVERALVVHGAGGLDELSPAGVNAMAVVEDGALRRTPVSPRELGLGRCDPAELVGGNAIDNAATIRAIFAGARGPKRDAVTLNAAAGLVAAGLADDLAAGLELAGAAIDDGRAEDTLLRVARASQARRGTER